MFWNFSTVFLFSISYEFLCDVSLGIQCYSSLGFVKESLQQIMWFVLDVPDRLQRMKNCAFLNAVVYRPHVSIIHD